MNSPQTTLALEKTASPSDWDFFDRVAERFSSFRFDPFDLFWGFTRNLRGSHWSAQDIRRFWELWARDARGGIKAANISLYIHIPFCTKKCTYCMFFSGIPRGQEDIDAYLQTLAQQARYFSVPFSGIRFRHLAIGGGTPGLLTSGQMDFLLETLFRHFEFHDYGDRLFECTPGSVTPDKLDVLKKRGINRVSIGVQSLNPRTLQEVNRGEQDAATVLRAIRDVKASGFERGATVQLMLGLVHETPDSFLAGLRTIAQERPEVLIVYAIRPVERYARRHYAGDAQAAFLHYQNLVPAVIATMNAIAQDSGYVKAGRSFGGSLDREWFFIQRKCFSNFSTPESCYSAEQTVLPFSLLGLGPTARSHIWGYGNGERLRSHRAAL